MTLRRKRRIRLLILASVVGLISSLLLGGYLWREHARAQDAQAQRQRGLEAMEVGDYRGAMNHLGKYLRVHDKDPALLYKYAVARQKIEEPDRKHIFEAIGILERVRQLDPQHEQARDDLLELYTDGGYSTEAVSLADEILAASPEHFEAMQAKAVALSRLRRFDEAMPLARRCAELDPLHLRAHVLVLQLMKQMEQPASQLLAYTADLRQRDPDEPRYTLLEAYALEQLGRREESLQWLGRAAELDPPDADHAMLLVTMLDQARRFNWSLAVLRRVSPEIRTPTIARELTRRLWEVHDFDALIALQDGLDLSDQTLSTERLGLTAMALLRQARTEQATRYIDALEERDAPRANGWVQVLRYIAQPQTRTAPEGIENYLAALEEDKNNAYFRNLLGNAYASVADDDAALRQWELAADARPIWAEPYLQRATLLLERNRVRESLDAASAAMVRAPQRIDAVVVWARARYANLQPTGRDDRQSLLNIVETARKWADQEPHLAALNVRLLLELNRPADAVAIIKQLLATDLPDQDALLAVANVCADHDLALEDDCYVRAEQLHGMTPRLALAKATALARRDNVAGGIELLRQAADDAGANDTSLTWRLARATYLDRVGHPEAVEAWTTLVDDFPQKSRIQHLALRASCLASHKQVTDRALARLREHATDGSSTWDMEHARLLLRQRDDDAAVAEAAALLERVVARAPMLVEARMLLVESLTRMNHHAQAIQHLTTAANLRPTSNAIALRLAMALQAQHNHTEAALRLRRIIDRPHTDADTLQTVATLLAQQGRISEAQALLEQLDGQGVALQPDALILLASRYEQSNQPAKARAMRDRLLASPSPQGLLFVATHYADTGRRELADQVMDQLATLNLDDDVVHDMRARFHLRVNELDEAVAHLRRAVTEAPDHPPYHHDLVRLHLHRGENQAAIDAAQAGLETLAQDKPLTRVVRNSHVIAQVPADSLMRPLVHALLGEHGDVAAQVLNQTIGRAGQRPSLDQALTPLRDAARRHPYFLALQNVAAELLLMRGRSSEALVIAERAIETFPLAAEPARLAAEALLAERRWDELLTIVRRWRQRNPADAPAIDLIEARAQLELRRTAAAKNTLEARLDPNAEQHEAAALLYVRALLMEGRAQQAVTLMSDALASSSSIRQSAARLLPYAKDVATAERWLSALEKATTDATERVHLAQTLHQEGRRRDHAPWRDRAARMLDDVLKQPQPSAAAWLLRGTMAEQAGDLALAQSCYRSALKADPNQVVAMNNLAAVLIAGGGAASDAYELARQAVERAPTVPAFLDTLATVQFHRREFDAALASLAQAVELAPNDPEWRLRRAQLLDKMGRHDESKSVVAEVVEAHGRNVLQEYDWLGVSLRDP